MSGPDWKPSTCTSLPQLLPAEERHERGRDAGDARQRGELFFETLEQLARPLGLVAR